MKVTSDNAGNVNEDAVLAALLEQLNNGQTALYFGYGSNLNSVDYLAWCREKGLPETTLKAVTPAILCDHQLVFSGGERAMNGRRKGGVCSVEPLDGHVVYGVLFEVSISDVEMLRIKEGCKVGYYQEIGVVVNSLTDPTVSYTALTYSITPQWNRHLMPSFGYVSAVLGGLQEHSLPTTSIKQALAAIGFDAQSLFTSDSSLPPTIE
eukprot:GILK01008753.1.p1 GENE.GILK01008753.1~~GILK01008753.1.p1  ORF type:complete len:208 (-),score=29.08 GILK01008753.1:71-694(-)